MLFRSVVLYFLMFSLILLLLLGSLNFKRDSPSTGSIVHLNTMDISIDGGEFYKIKLPNEIPNLKPGTRVVLKTTIRPHPYDGVYVKSNYAKANVYLDDNITFTLGRTANYPVFMADPAKEIHIIETYGKDKPMKLSIEYFSPKTISYLHLDTPMLGTTKELMLEKAKTYGASMIFAFTQYLWGFVLLLISIYLIFLDKKGIMFFWLGLFSIATGSWFFGSNDMAITVFPNTTFLYLSGYIGFITFVPTLIKLIRTSVQLSRDKISKYLEGFTFAVAFITFILQIAGIYPLHKTTIFIQLVIIFSMLLMTGLLIYDYLDSREERVKDLIGPMVILTVSIITDFVMKWLTLIRPPITPAQVGTIIFLMIMGIYTGRAIRDNVELSRQEKELAIKKEMLDIQTEEQRESRLLLVENEKVLSRQRHDMRHHLTAIQEMLDEDQYKLQEYLSTLIDKIPHGKIHYCDNAIVDAMVSHFASICNHNNIDFSAKLVVPESGNQTLDSDLCVIFANLLENATEACLRMPSEEPRYVSIRSKLQYDLLVITMDNSYDGNITKDHDGFRSSKRNQIGIGLTSVKSIVEQHSGSARFIPKDDVFESSVYLKIK